jgi:hypothetical protein
VGWLKALFMVGGGPMAWLAAAWSFVASVFMWCIRNWKITLPIVILLAAFYGGMRYERKGWVAKGAAWEAKWKARDAKDEADAEQRIRTNHDLQIAYEHLDAQASQDKAAREAKYQGLEKRMNDYVAKHSGDSCDVGDDGLQLVVDAIRARRRDPR